MNTDKKTPNNIKYYRVKTIQGEDAGDIYQLISLLLGIIGFIFRVKWCCWISLLFVMSSYVNTKYNAEQKQLIMNFGLIFIAFFMVYMPQHNSLIQSSTVANK